MDHGWELIKKKKTTQKGHCEGGHSQGNLNMDWKLDDAKK